MENTKKQTARIIKGVVAALTAVLALIAICFFCARKINLKKQIKNVLNGNYRIAVFSTENYCNNLKKLYEDYLGVDIFYENFKVTSDKEITALVESAIASGNELSEIVLFLDPCKADASSVIGNHPEISFKVIYPCRSQVYWEKMSASKFERVKEVYKPATENYIKLSNLSLYSLTSEEWFVTNSVGFEKTKLCEEGMKELFLSVYGYDTYKLTEANVDQFFNKFDKLNGGFELKTADLSDYEIIMFGDSIFANDRSFYSLEGLLETRANVKVYNLAIGGTLAADFVPDSISFARESQMILSDNDNYEGKAASFYEEWKKVREDDACGKKKIILISFGTNDYFYGSSIEEMKAGYKAGLEALMTLYPDAIYAGVIVYDIKEYEYGTRVVRDDGVVLADYRKAVSEVLNEYGVNEINLYEETGFSPANIDYYCPDGTHPGRPGGLVLFNIVLMHLLDYCQ